MKSVVLFIFIIVVILTPCFALTAPITSISDPALSGALLIDFESVETGNYGSLTIGSVSFIPNGSLYILDYLSGQYNTTGQYLANVVYFNSIAFLFDDPVSAFGFNIGLSNEDWLLSAYDIGGNLIDSFVLPRTLYSNAGDFFGIAAPGISYAALTQVTFGESPDYILLDNFNYQASQVPIPGAVWLLGSGLFGLVGLRKKLCG